MFELTYNNLMKFVFQAEKEIYPTLVQLKMLKEKRKWKVSGLFGQYAMLVIEN